MNRTRARALTDMHSRTCTRTAVSGLRLQQTVAGEPPRSARAERAARALSLGSPFAHASTEMGPVMAALALLFVNGYGLLAVSSKAGLGPRLAWTAALLLGATCVPSAAAIAAAPPSRSAAVLRSWRGAGGAAPQPARVGFAWLQGRPLPRLLRFNNIGGPSLKILVQIYLQTCRQLKHSYCQYMHLNIVFLYLKKLVHVTVSFYVINNFLFSGNFFKCLLNVFIII